MRLDKKARGNRLRFVLLDGLARPVTVDDPDPALLAAAYAEGEPVTDADRAAYGCWCSTGPTWAGWAPGSRRSTARTTHAELAALCVRAGAELGLAVEVRQSDAEAELIGWLHEAADERLPVVLNAGALTHTSIALRDAAPPGPRRWSRCTSPTSHAREEFRHHSYLSAVASGVIVGLGVEGYVLALSWISSPHRRRAPPAEPAPDCHRLRCVQRWRGLEAIPAGWGRCVATIGVFDGLHRGHQQIIARARELADELGLPTVLVTFTPHPSEVVRPGSHPPLLTTNTRKAELADELGVDVVVFLPFTLEFSQLSPEEFVHQAVVADLHAAAVVVGENFRFGHQAAGDVATLAELGRRWGFAAEGVPLLAEDGRADLLHLHPLLRARPATWTPPPRALGRPHRLDGVVVRGDQRGRDLGFPTANVRAESFAAVPADGVYAGRVVRIDEWGNTRADDPAADRRRSRSAPTRPSRAGTVGRGLRAGLRRRPVRPEPRRRVRAPAARHGALRLDRRRWSSQMAADVEQTRRAAGLSRATPAGCVSPRPGRAGCVGCVRHCRWTFSPCPAACVHHPS